MPEPEPPRQRPPDGIREPVMFWLACFFLLVLGAAVHRHRDPTLDLPPEQREIALQHDPLMDNWELRLELMTLLALWPVFFVESLWRFLTRDRSLGFWRPFFQVVAITLIPPVRISARDLHHRDRIWFPVLGWRGVDKELRKHLEKMFSVPMILIALMVLPVLAVEWGWEKLVQENLPLRLFVSFGNTIIWFAFAFEFLVMIQVAKNKLRYTFSQWLNLAVILLPLIEFLPLLRMFRLGRVLRLNKLSRMGRLYRLRGLAMRAWRAILILEVIQRLFGGTLEKRLRSLEEIYAAKEEEMEELRQEIEEVREMIAEQNAKAMRSTILELWRKEGKCSTSTADSHQ